MVGNGNNLRTFWQKLYFMLIPTSGGRSRYITKHAELFRHVGKELFYQPRVFPSDPELISFGDNVNVAAGVVFINHDIVHAVLNKRIKLSDGNTDSSNGSFRALLGPIKIGDNVMIGARTIILPNVKVGDNVIIGAGSIIAKDIPSNSIVAGVPAKVIGKFDSFVKKRMDMGNANLSVEEIWKNFEKEREN